MTCMICRINPASVKCFECQIHICQECATFYIVDIGCCAEICPMYLCPDCLKEYRSGYTAE